MGVALPMLMLMGLQKKGFPSELKENENLYEDLLTHKTIKALLTRKKLSMQLCSN